MKIAARILQDTWNAGKLAYNSNSNQYGVYYDDERIYVFDINVIVDVGENSAWKVLPTGSNIILTQE